MKKIIILGGSGFIGTRLTKNLLEKDHEVVIGDIVKSKEYPELWKKCDITDKADLFGLMSGCEVIINLAAEHRDDVKPISLYEKTNVIGSRLICQIASELGIKKIIFTSSVAIYGFPKSAYDEDGPRNPFNEYGRTKLLAENEYNQWLVKKSDRSLFIIRPTVVFGEGNRGNVYNLLKQISTGRFIMIGRGENKKSMAYIGNLVSFIEWGLDRGIGTHIYNYVDTPDLDMNSLVTKVNSAIGIRGCQKIKVPFVVGWLGGLAFDILAKLTGRKFSVSRIRVRKFCAQTVFSSKKMQESTFNPPFGLSKALVDTVKYEFEYLTEGEQQEIVKDSV